MHLQLLLNVMHLLLLSFGLSTLLFLFFTCAEDDSFVELVMLKLLITYCRSCTYSSTQLKNYERTDGQWPSCANMFSDAW